MRALECRTGTALPAGTDYFGGDDGNTHEASINKAAAAGIAAGKSAGVYQPAVPVRRDQVASFVARLLDLLVEEGYAAVPQT